MQILSNEPMCLHTSFCIGGPAARFVRPESVDEVCALIREAKCENTPLHVMGLGSNLLVSDAGLPGTVMQLADNLARIELLPGQRIYAQAGASNKDVAAAALSAGLTGYEFASGIPGSIGGAAYMNAGAYDGEFSQVCAYVDCIDPSGEPLRIQGSQAAWGYRKSLMADNDYVIVGAMLQLACGEPAQIAATMDELRQRRESKQPLDLPSAGSTFKRPEGYFAGKLIQDAGLKGLRVGGAQVSTLHSGFVVNVDNASATDVRALIVTVQQRVFQEFGVMLEPEVRMWGFGDD